MCGKHSRECNLQDLLVLFPKHGLCLPAAVRENDRTREATEIKLNSFIFALASREQNANKQKLNISELWNRSVWKKQIYDLYTTLLPPPQEFPGPLTLPPLWNFQSLPWGRYGYFLEPHIGFEQLGPGATVCLTAVKLQMIGNKTRHV